MCCEGGGLHAWVCAVIYSREAFEVKHAETVGRCPLLGWRISIYACNYQGAASVTSHWPPAAVLQRELFSAKSLSLKVESAVPHHSFSAYPSLVGVLSVGERAGVAVKVLCWTEANLCKVLAFVRPSSSLSSIFHTCIKPLTYQQASQSSWLKLPLLSVNSEPSSLVFPAAPCGFQEASSGFPACLSLTLCPVTRSLWGALSLLQLHPPAFLRRGSVYI